MHDFPTPEERNKLLYDHALLTRSKDSGLNKSNVKGWHSSGDLSREAPLEPFFKDVRKVIKMIAEGMGFKGIQLVLAGAWYIISPPGAFNTKHLHPRAFLSGVYYIKAPPQSSPLVFHDPRHSKVYGYPTQPAGTTSNIFTADVVTFEAKEGRLIVFPGWLEHSVPENVTPEDRVILSFNCMAL